jgi:hypothetical protein
VCAEEQQEAKAIAGSTCEFKSSALCAYLSEEVQKGGCNKDILPQMRGITQHLATTKVMFTVL